MVNVDVQTSYVHAQLRTVSPGGMSVDVNARCGTLPLIHSMGLGQLGSPSAIL